MLQLLPALFVIAVTGGASAQTVRNLAAFAGVQLADHRAVYDLSMARGDGMGMTVGGRLVLEFRNVCEGFTLSQRLRTQTTTPDGETTEGDYSVTSWESMDGLRYRFNVRHLTDGEPPEEFVGTARIAKRGAAGTVTFTKPAGEKLALPAGTVFPSEHLAILIREARAGSRFAPVKVFEGSGDDGVFDVGGSIGKEYPAGSASAPLLAPMKSLRAWQVRLAYFPIAKGAEQPQYEMGFRLFENGVSDELILDYGDYALKGTLTALQLFPKPNC
jgi:hypothetical protein